MKQRKQRCTGFPSPADDYKKAQLSLDDLLIQHPAATYFVRMKGDAMLRAGIYEDDVLVVDRSLFPPKHMDIIIAVVNSEHVVRRYMLEGGQVWLRSANTNVPSVLVSKDSEFMIWGVVTVVLHYP